MVNLELINNLWLQIDKVHLSYLQTEESLQRIEQKKKLEAYMKEYLCMVASNQRFYFATTKDVLYTSILRRNVPTANFSLSKFCHAWEMLGMYAANLIGQPWRKEFKEIRLYSGAYKYQIGQQLVGAEEILKQMGFTLDVELDCLIVQGMLDYDRLVLVSRDCLLAKVESQILSEIHVALRTCSWSDIFEYRDQYVGTVSHCVRGLMYQFHQKKSMMQYQYAMGPIGPHEMYPTSVPYHNYPYPLSPELYAMPYLPVSVDEPDPKHQFLDFNMFERPQPAPSQGPFGKVAKSVPTFDCNFDIDRLEQLCYEDLDFTDGVPQRKLMKEKPVITPSREYADEFRGYRDLIQIQDTANITPAVEESRGFRDLFQIEGTSNSSHFTPARGEFRGYSELIQVEGASNNPRNMSTEDSRSYRELIQVEGPSNNPRSRSTAEESKVYRELIQVEGSPNNPRNRSTGEEFKNYRELIQVEGPSSKPRNRSTAEEFREYRELIKVEDASNNPRNRLTGEEPKSYHELIQVEGPSNNPHNRAAGEEFKDYRELIKIEGTSNNSHNKLNREEPKVYRELVQIEGWECLSCTYVNREDSEICDMCAKSRRRGPECHPLLRGGRECSQCTLVNPPEQVECQACSTSLNYAPTYI